MFGICSLSIIPIRKEPKEQSEMISQLLFGETYEVTEISEKWIKILVFHDKYEGWIDKKMYEKISSDEYINYEELNSSIVYDSSTKILDNNSFYSNIVMGSLLPKYSNGKFKINEQEYSSDCKAITKLDSQYIEAICLKFLNSPYLWGGRTPFGIDCSGFSQMVYRFLGINIPRDAWQQELLGETVNLNDSKDGDLAFFCNKKGNITHVGIMLSNNRIIHSSGKVKIEKIDSKGIINSEGEYTHTLNSIKRYL